nr:hypothetical protein CFP56_65217 [Quercus suber]
MISRSPGLPPPSTLRSRGGDRWRPVLTQCGPGPLSGMLWAQRACKLCSLPMMIAVVRLYGRTPLIRSPGRLQQCLCARLRSGHAACYMHYGTFSEQPKKSCHSCDLSSVLLSAIKSSDRDVTIEEVQSGELGYTSSPVMIPISWDLSRKIPLRIAVSQTCIGHGILSGRRGLTCRDQYHG